MTGLPVKVGTRIELVAMPYDPDPVPVGTQGVVTGGNAEQIWVDWDNGRRLALVVGVDTWRTIVSKSYGYEYPSRTQAPRIIDHSDWPMAIGLVAAGMVFDPYGAGSWFVQVEMVDGVMFLGAVMAYDPESYLIVLTPVDTFNDDPDYDDIDGFIQLPADAVKTLTIP